MIGLEGLFSCCAVCIWISAAQDAKFDGEPLASVRLGAELLARIMRSTLWLAIKDLPAPLTKLEPINDRCSKLRVLVCGEAEPELM